MNDKRNYLVEKLTKEENAYLKKVVINARNKYIRDNFDFLQNKSINIDDTLVIDDSSVLDVVIEKCEKEIKSAVEFEKMISNVKLYNAVKTLSFKEKMVLFSLYSQNKNVNQIAREMGIAREKVWRLKNRTLDKLMKSILGGN